MTAKSNLNTYNYEKLLDDIKLISRSLKIAIYESSKKKREFAGILTENLMTRLFRDIQEMHDGNLKNKDSHYGGYLEKGE